MDKKKLIEVLNQHAGGLSEGVELRDRLLVQYPGDVQTLSPLFDLASAVKAAIPRVKVPEVKARLFDRVVRQMPTEPVSIRRTSPSGWPWLILAAFGSLLSAAGLVLLIVRRLRIRAARKEQTQTAAAAI